jgi:hypothetical protein
VGFFNHPAREFAPVEGIINDGEGQKGEQNQYDSHDVILTFCRGTRLATVKVSVFNQMQLLQLLRNPAGEGVAGDKSSGFNGLAEAWRFSAGVANRSYFGVIGD